MEAIILTKELVKPSMPTPPHLRNHKLCLFDQLTPAVCITPIFFYKNNTTANFFDNHLKTSLSKTLTLFYPLAGALSSEEPTFVDCNDNGVLYVEAHVKNVSLDEFLQDPELPQLINFLPQNSSLSSTMNYVQNLETPVSIQVTRFNCGGIAIGGVFYHKLLDGVSMGIFFDTWAKIARGGDNGVEETCLDFTSLSLLFPTLNRANELLETKNMMIFDEGKSIVRRFVFSARAIEAIKVKGSTESVPNPTRVEALTAFIWKHMILATRAVNGISSRPFMVSHAVNLRSRFDPQLPNAIGNLVSRTNSGFREIISEVVELPQLMEIVREMFEKMNKGNLLKAVGGDNVLDGLVAFGTQFEKLLPHTCKFSSWCNFGFYDVDFGWGKPVFFAPFIDTIGSSNKQQIILVESGKCGGIEAWILRNNEEMIELENDEEFLAFASPNPNVQYAP
ncbi:putative serine/threonine protein phosphatase 2A 57 kDa regulatory subunit B' beta isoform-like [Capsicum annuum]|uniref:vinorine synthase-like n=1 Tax=Capsicum annuum TaxID=4072 RepID=UPI0007BF85E7|nr:vinorine synthase-like [Capsicum annuum]KAF3633102.1 putative serine/threonine protein phosphatase 2A 57 kDa regulatory subunit B' beta isoform-like [Capsicum annuum]